MDSFEFNKIAGAVLAALLVLFGTKTFFEVWKETSHEGTQVAGYELPAPKGGTDTAATAATTGPAAFSFATLKPLLAKANAEGGQQVFRKCTACHTADKGGANRVGPNLHDIVGRKVASKEGFNYSAGLKKIEGDWTYEKLAGYLHDPKGFAPGNKMAFAGIKENPDLADLIAYLRSVSDSPPPLPN